MTQSEQAIRDFIRQEFLRDQPQTELASDEPLIQTGIVDSLGIFLLVGFLEQEFGIQIQPQDVVLENFETINAIAALVAARRPSNARQGRAP